MKTLIRENKTWELHAEHGKVSFLMGADKDKVRNVMPETGAFQMMEQGTLTVSDIEGHPICVNDRYYFPGKVTEMPKKKRGHMDETESLQ